MLNTVIHFSFVWNKKNVALNARWTQTNKNENVVKKVFGDNVCIYLEIDKETQSIKGTPHKHCYHFHRIFALSRRLNSAPSAPSSASTSQNNLQNRDCQLNDQHFQRHGQLHGHLDKWINTIHRESNEHDYRIVVVTSH